MYLFGELNKIGDECVLPQDKKPHYFEKMERGKKDWNQILITERAINCALYAFEKSSFANFTISTKNIETYFNITNVIIDVSTVSQFIPQFKEKFDKK